MSPGVLAWCPHVCAPLWDGPQISWAVHERSLVKVIQDSPAAKFNGHCSALVHLQYRTQLITPSFLQYFIQMEGDAVSESPCTTKPLSPEHVEMVGHSPFGISLFPGSPPTMQCSRIQS